VDLLQLIVTGVSIGAVYSLIGLGIVFTYTTTRVINFAIGEFAMLSALSAVSFVALGAPVALGAIGGVLVGSVAGFAMYQFAIRPAQSRGATILAIVILTIALQLALEGVGLIIWGTHSYDLPPFTAGRPLAFFGAVITRQNLWIIAGSAVILAVLWTFFYRTNLGKALRACAVNPVGSRLMGIPVVRMGAVAFVLSAALAAAGGVLITPERLAEYDMGLMLTVKGFVGAVIGRMSSPVLTVAGALFLGVSEALAAGLFHSGYRNGVAFVVLIAALLWRAVPVLKHGVLAVEEATAE
jgi:branched-chain amino acid transport system permease protein